MATDPKNPAGVSMASLVGGIVTGVQDLVKQHLNLFRQEAIADFRKANEAALSVARAVVLALAGVPC